jgi:hypothetical protein
MNTGFSILDLVGMRRFELLTPDTPCLRTEVWYLFDKYNLIVDLERFSTHVKSDIWEYMNQRLTMGFCECYPVFILISAYGTSTH